MMNFIKRVHNYYKTIIRRTHSAFQLRFVKYGNNTNVFGKIDIVFPENLKIGSDCSLNHGCYINASNGVILGDDVTLSAKSIVVSTGINYLQWINGRKCHTKDKAIQIGDHVWIGANAIILPGVSITGEYVVVAANAVVTKSITESYCIYAGVPARKQKHIYL